MNNKGFNAFTFGKLKYAVAWNCILIFINKKLLPINSKSPVFILIDSQTQNFFDYFETCFHMILERVGFCVIVEVAIIGIVFCVIAFQMLVSGAPVQIFHFSRSKNLLKKGQRNPWFSFQ